MLRPVAGICAAVLCGCMSENGPLSLLEILPESFPPYGIAFQRYEAPQFPYELRATAIVSGYSIVAVTVDDQGRVEDAVAVEASDAAFARAVLEVAPAWIFEVTGGEATEPRREVLHYRFRRSGVVSTLTHLEGAKSQFVESQDDFARIRMVPMAQLDTQLMRIAPATNSEPTSSGAASAGAASSGTAELSFVIDESGYVRVPTVIVASDPAIGAAALSAIKEWRFSTPLHRGEPVLVEGRARWGE